MDFLTLMIAYGVTFSVVSYVLFLGDSNFHRHGIVGRIRRGTIQVIGWLHSTLLPKAAQESLNKLINYLLYQRNPCFKYFYIVVLLLVLYYYTTDVIPLAMMVGTPPPVILGSYFWFASCLSLFLFCCGTDPGVITAESLHRFKDVYDYDGVLYLEGSECWTCKIKKLARSKHCATCNHCVYRFDHHCTWLNHCVGGLNVRYFMALVASLTFGTGFVSYSIASTLSLFVESTGLLRASYVGPDGRLRPVTWQVALQHLFMERPMPVFIMMSLALLCLLVAAFMVYHVYLAATNQTTNERYKKSHRPTSLDECGLCSSAKSTRPTKNSKKTNRKRNPHSGDDVCHHGNMYNRGLVSNISEVILPLYKR